MSFRIHVVLKKKDSKETIDSHQLLGNNEDYFPLTEEFKRQGVNIPDGCDCYSGRIYEIDPITKILEQYIWDKKEEIEKFYNWNIFDLSPRQVDEKKQFTYTMREHQKNAYIFSSANFLNFLENHNAVDWTFTKDGDSYVLKDEYELYVDAG